MVVPKSRNFVVLWENQAVIADAAALKAFFKIWFEIASWTDSHVMKETVVKPCAVAGAGVISCTVIEQRTCTHVCTHTRTHVHMHRHRIWEVLASFPLPAPRCLLSKPPPPSVSRTVHRELIVVNRNLVCSGPESGFQIVPRVTYLLPPGKASWPAARFQAPPRRVCALALGRPPFLWRGKMST